MTDRGKHEYCIAIIDAIDRYERQKQMKLHSIENFPKDLIGLHARMRKDVDKLNLVIGRLRDKYFLRVQALIG